MFGKEAARHINDVGGKTIHRRGLALEDKLIDLHLRIADSELSKTNSSECFLNQLGSESSSLGDDIYKQYLIQFIIEVNRFAENGQAFGNCPIYGDCEQNDVLEKCSFTLLHSIIRNYKVVPCNSRY